jgi:hypothetical protein
MIVLEFGSIVYSQTVYCNNQKKHLSHESKPKDTECWQVMADEEINLVNPINSKNILEDVLQKLFDKYKTAEPFFKSAPVNVSTICKGYVIKEHLNTEIFFSNLSVNITANP